MPSTKKTTTWTAMHFVCCSCVKVELKTVGLLWSAYCVAYPYTNTLCVDFISFPWEDNAEQKTTTWTAMHFVCCSCVKVELKTVGLLWSAYCVAYPYTNTLCVDFISFP